MKYLFWMAIALLLLPGPLATAQEEKEEVVAEKGVDESPFQILKKEIQAADKAFAVKRGKLVKELQAAKDDDARQAIMDQLGPLQKEAQSSKEKVGQKVKDLIEATDSKEKCLEMTVWMLKNMRSPDMQVYAVEQILANHIKSEKIIGVFPALSQSMPSESTRLALEKIAKEGANDNIKGNASISLVELILQGRAAKDFFGEDGEVPNGMPEAYVKLIKKSMEYSDEQIEAMFKDAAEKYGDVKYRNSTISKFVAKRLKAIEMQKMLQVGKVAPDIEGLDIDGVNFKLSDYRGKVVMLDFWGDW